MLTRNHFSGPFKQAAEHLEFLHRHHMRAAHDLNFIMLPVDRHPRKRQLRIRHRMHTFQHRADAEQELLRLKGLHYIILGPRREPLLLVIELSLRRQHDHRNLKIPAQNVRQFKTVHPGHHHIHDRNIHFLILKIPEGAVSIAEIGHIKAIPLQVEYDQIADIRIILDHHHFIHRPCTSVKNSIILIQTQYKYFRNENSSRLMNLDTKKTPTAPCGERFSTGQPLCAEAHFRTERLEVDAAFIDAHFFEFLHHCAHEAHGSADVDLSVFCTLEVLLVQEAFGFAEFDFE